MEFFSVTFRVLTLLFVNGIRSSAFGKDLDQCQDALGMETGDIADSQLTASTSQYGRGPSKARIRNGRAAWCPLVVVTPEHYTYLQVDLPRLTVVTRIETQGRRQVRGEFTDEFIVEFQRYQDESSWRRFYQKDGKEIFVANTDQYHSVYQNLDPPLIARRIRLVPFVRTRKTICLTMELYGCPSEEAVLSYRIPQGHTYRPSPSQRPTVLDDTSYDGRLDDASLSYRNGLGKLTDFAEGSLRWKEERDTPWVGWDRRRLKTDDLTLVFEFDGLRNVSRMTFHTLINRMDDIDTFESARLECSSDGENFQRAIETFDPEKMADSNTNNNNDNNNIRALSIPVSVMKNAVCKLVRVTLKYKRGMDWILISEVFISSEPASVSKQQQQQNAVHTAVAKNGNAETTSGRRKIGDVIAYEESRTGDSGNGAASTVYLSLFLYHSCLLLYLSL